MRLYRGKIEIIADEVIVNLCREDSITVANVAEAKLDVEAVLKEYLRLERDMVEEAKNRMEVRGLGYSNLGRVKGQVAKERGQPAQDDAVPYLVDQILNILFHSANVDEIFAEDTALRQEITNILRRNMDVESDLDREVRSKIKNLQEGTSTFDVEYERVMEQIKRRKRLS